MEQFLSLNDVIKQQSAELFILNTSRPKGNITFEVPNGLGGRVSIIIQATWIPIDLTTQATREDIIKSPSLRRLHAAGFLKFPTPEHVQQLLKKEGANKEVQRVYNASTTYDFSADGSPVNAEAKALIEGENVSGFVLNLVNATDLDEPEALNSVRQQEDSLSSEDLKYLMDNCKFPKVKAFAAEALSTRNA